MGKSEDGSDQVRTIVVDDGCDIANILRLRLDAFIPNIMRRRVASDKNEVGLIGEDCKIQ